MLTRTRWQDWITALLGVALFVSPFVLGDTSQTAAAWTAWVGGVLLFVFGGGMLLARRERNFEYLPLVLGILLFIAPWVLGFSGVTAMAWSAWIIGVLAFVAAVSALVPMANRSAMTQ